jgi:F0F1-type ATP synthase membrane subunit c/vacuolar-type H+-ATPase subunit K
LAATLGNIGSARVGAIATVQAEKEKTKKTLLVVGLIAGAVIIGGLVFILSKRK